MTAKKPYSIRFNQKAKVWQANIKLPNGSWSTKGVPAALGFGLAQALQAEAWIVAYMDDLYAGRLTSSAPKITIAMLADRMLEYRKNDNTTKIKTYTSLIYTMDKVLNTPMANLDIVSELNVAEAKKWYDSLTVGVQTKRSLVGNLSGMLRDAIINEWLPETYQCVFRRPGFAAHMKSAKAGAKEHEIIVAPHATISELLAHRIERYRLTYALAYYCALRRSEINGLSWEDIDLDKGIIRVRKQLIQAGTMPYVHARGMSKEEIVRSTVAVMGEPKYGSARDLPIHPRLREILVAAPVARAPGAPVCPAARARYGRSQRTLLETTKRGITMHSLRRTAATDLAIAGVSDDHIGLILGHGTGKNKTLRLHYVRSEVETYRADIERLPYL